MNFQNIFCLRLLKLKMIGYIDRVQCKITESALTGCNVKGAYSPLRAFFMRNFSMHSHHYGEAGEGHFRVCWYSNEPVCQPFSALPPLLGSKWQSF